MILSSSDLDVILTIMAKPDRFYVYILASFTRVLYIGSTTDITRRILEHKQKVLPGFTAKYHVDRLVHLEEYTNRLDASNREREFKGMDSKEEDCTYRGDKSGLG